MWSFDLELISQRTSCWAYFIFNKMGTFWLLLCVVWLTWWRNTRRSWQLLRRLTLVPFILWPWKHTLACPFRRLDTLLAGATRSRCVCVCVCVCSLRPSFCHFLSLTHHVLFLAGLNDTHQSGQTQSQPHLYKERASGVSDCKWVCECMQID